MNTSALEDDKPYRAIDGRFYEVAEVPLASLPREHFAWTYAGRVLSGLIPLLLSPRFKKGEKLIAKKHELMQELMKRGELERLEKGDLPTGLEEFVTFHVARNCGEEKRKIIRWAKDEKLIGPCVSSDDEEMIEKGRACFRRGGEQIFYMPFFGSWIQDYKDAIEDRMGSRNLFAAYWKLINGKHAEPAVGKTTLELSLPISVLHENKPKVFLLTPKWCSETGSFYLWQHRLLDRFVRCSGFYRVVRISKQPLEDDERGVWGYGSLPDRTYYYKGDDKTGTYYELEPVGDFKEPTNCFVCGAKFSLGKMLDEFKIQRSFVTGWTLPDAQAYFPIIHALSQVKVGSLVAARPPRGGLLFCTTCRTVSQALHESRFKEVIASLDGKGLCSTCYGSAAQRAESGMTLTCSSCQSTTPLYRQYNRNSAPIEPNVLSVG
jgi:hypothetical protein